jgi:pimeloyl-ACP methyl ester carboxylesterase
MKILRRIGLALAAFLLLNAACVLIPVRTKGVFEPRQLADPDSRFIELAGVDVHYKLYPATPTLSPAERPLIVLLHGFGASLFSWREVVGPLSVYGDVVAYDRPAFGLTGRPATWKGMNPYSPAAQVDMVIGLMDALGARQAVLVGNSAGGTVAMNTALAYPDRVAALVLVSPAVYGGGGAPGWIQPFFWLPGINHIGPLLARRISRDGDDFIRSAWYDAGRMGPEVLPGYRAPLQVRGWEKALWELAKASAASSLSARLPEITLPALVLTGDTDRIVPTGLSIRLAGELPKATLVVIPESGHVAHEETPAAFMKAFEEFWEGQVVCSMEEPAEKQPGRSGTVTP